MKVLVINAGSSSIKYQLIDMQNENLVAKGLVERIGSQSAVLTHKANGNVTEIKQSLKDHSEGLELLLKTLLDDNFGVIKSLDEISAIGHRVVHGGGKYSHATLIEEVVLEDLKSFVALAPLHMPPNIQGIEACKNVMKGKQNVAVFDTAFHTSMPDYAYMYAVPFSWCKEYGVRKYGFHGTSHQFIATETARVLGKKLSDLRIISCHLGNGASICAVQNGKCVDTSMGFTPLEGLMMGTRSGDIDPAVVEYMMGKTGMNVHQIIDILNKKSGLLGMSGISNDMRDVIKAANEGETQSQIALKKFVYFVKKYIGSYAAVMNGVDAIAFSAGTGENRADIRAAIMENMDFLGVDFDKEANQNFERGVNFKISKENSKVAVLIIPTDEEMSIARQTKSVLEQKNKKINKSNKLKREKK